MINQTFEPIARNPPLIFMVLGKVVDGEINLKTGTL